MNKPAKKRITRFLALYMAFLFALLSIPHSNFLLIPSESLIKEEATSFPLVNFGSHAAEAAPDTLSVRRSGGTPNAGDSFQLFSTTDIPVNQISRHYIFWYVVKNGQTIAGSQTEAVRCSTSYQECRITINSQSRWAGARFHYKAVLWKSDNSEIRDPLDPTHTNQYDFPSTAPPAPVVDIFTATPSAVSPGGNVTLTWSVSSSEPTAIEIMAGDVLIYSGSSLLGSKRVNPAMSTTYSIIAMAGTIYSDVKTAQVTVSGTSALTANPQSVSMLVGETKMVALSSGTPPYSNGGTSGDLGSRDIGFSISESTLTIKDATKAGSVTITIRDSSSPAKSVQIPITVSAAATTASDKACTTAGGACQMIKSVANTGGYFKQRQCFSDRSELYQCKYQNAGIAGCQSCLRANNFWCYKSDSAYCISTQSNCVSGYQIVGNAPGCENVLGDETPGAPSPSPTPTPSPSPGGLTASMQTDPQVIVENAPFSVTFTLPSPLAAGSVLKFRISGQPVGQLTQNNCVGNLCTTSSYTLRAGTHTVSASILSGTTDTIVTLTPTSFDVKPKEGELTPGKPLTSASCSECIELGVQGMCTNGHRYVCANFGTDCGQNVASYSYRDCTPGRSDYTQAATCRECRNLPTPGNWCISRNQGYVSAQCRPPSQGCNVGETPSNACTEDLCQEACQNQYRGYGGAYGSYLSGYTFGSCNERQPISVQGIAVGGLSSSQILQAPQRIGGAGLCNDRRESCWCTTINYGSAVTGIVQSQSSAGVSTTAHWTPPNAVPEDKRPTFAANTAICEKINSTRINADITTPSIDRSQLKLFVAGDRIEVRGEVAKFSDTCRGYQYTCQAFQELPCDVDTGRWRDKYDYKSCPSALPEQLEARGKGSDWHVGRILNDIALAVSIAVSLGAFGSLGGAAFAPGSTIPAGTTVTAATDSVILGDLVAEGSIITTTQAVKVTSGMLATQGATTATKIATAAGYAQSLAPTLQGCPPNLQTLAVSEICSRNPSQCDLTDNPTLAYSFLTSYATSSATCQPKEPRVCFSVCGKTYKSEVAANPLCKQGGVPIYSPSGAADEKEYKCRKASCGGRENAVVSITMKSPSGEVIRNANTVTDANGKFSYTFDAPNEDGTITVILKTDSPEAPVTIEVTPDSRSNNPAPPEPSPPEPPVRNREP